MPPENIKSLLKDYDWRIAVSRPDRPIDSFVFPEK